MSYDIVQGNGYSLEGATLTASQMKLGIRDITITGGSTSANGILYVYGANFTPSSVVKINGVSKKTMFVSETMLMVSNADCNAGDEFIVAQISDDFTSLNETQPWIYKVSPVKILQMTPDGFALAIDPTR